MLRRDQARRHVAKEKGIKEKYDTTEDQGNDKRVKKDSEKVEFGSKVAAYAKGK